MRIHRHMEDTPDVSNLGIPRDLCLCLGSPGLSYEHIQSASEQRVKWGFLVHDWGSPRDHRSLGWLPRGRGSEVELSGGLGDRREASPVLTPHNPRLSRIPNCSLCPEPGLELTSLSPQGPQGTARTMLAGGSACLSPAWEPLARQASCQGQFATPVD